MHTNSTTYYNLPQFVGTDIVNDLTDTNGAYEAIDSAIHGVADSIGEDNAKIAALEAQNGSEVLTTTAQTLSGAVNELDGEINDATTGLSGRVTNVEAAQVVDAGKIETLETTVGDASTGLVKQVNTNSSNITELFTTVGDNNSGLVKSVNDLEAEDIVIQQSIGDLQSSIVRIDGKVGSAVLTTVAQDLSGAVNELNAGMVAPSAAEVSYSNATSGLVATNVQDAIDEIVGTSATVLADITANGSKTRATLLQEVFTAASASITNYREFLNTRFIVYNGSGTFEVANPVKYTGDSLVYMSNAASSTAVSFSQQTLKSSSCTWISADMLASGTTVTDTSSNTPASGFQYILVKV